MSATLTFSWSKPTSLASCADCSFEYKYALEATSLDGLTPTPVSFGTLSVTIPGLVNGESYHYAVRTICGPVQSKWSYGTTVVCDTIPVDTPTPTPTEVVQTPTPTPTVVPDTPTPTPTEVVQTPTPTPTAVVQTTTPTPTPTPIPECYYYTVTADDGTTDKNSYDFSYTNCNGDFIEMIVVNLGDRTVCAQEGTVSSESGFVDAILGSVCSEDPTPTPTPTPTEVVSGCYQYTVSTTASSAQYYSFTDCDGIPGDGYIGGVGGYDANTFCAQVNTISVGGEVNVSTVGPCVVEQTPTPTPTPTEGPTLPPANWRCDNGLCIEVFDGSGDYFTQLECQSGCQQTVYYCRDTEYGPCNAQAGPCSGNQFVCTEFETPQ
jgi:hypothetical protein